MGQKIQAVKGMNDLLPLEQKDFKLTSAFWQAFEDVVGKWTRRFGYSQIRTPILEQTGLFVRSIGEETDVVGKEMYTFSDSNDTLSLSLRPEGTASCLRAQDEQKHHTTTPQNQTTHPPHKSYGIWGRCSAANGRRKAVTVSFIRSAWKLWGLTAPMSMPK